MKGNNSVNATANTLLGVFTEGALKTLPNVCRKIERKCEITGKPQLCTGLEQMGFLLSQNLAFKTKKLC